MANFSSLKTAIQNAIKQNGNEEITGDVLQQILLSIVSTMGDGAINTIEQNLSSETLARQGADNTLQSHIDAEALARGNADTQLQNAINAIKADIDNGYVYAGIATPTTTPVSGKVFYIATAAGTYTNFGGQVLTQGINILRFNGSAWSSQQLIGIDDEPTPGSNNLVKSGGVLNSIIQNGPAFDLSAYNAVGGVLATYADLSAALTALNALDAAYKQPGMSFKFVHTNDNKYVQARCMAQNFTTDVTQWQGVDDVPTAGSDNLVKSRGVYDSQYQRNIEIEGEGDTYKEVLIGKFEKGQTVYCRFNPWPTTAASSGTTIFRIRKIQNGSSTNIINRGKGEVIPSSFSFVAEEGYYYFGGRADVGSSINGIFTYNCINEERVETIEQSILGINNSFNSYRGITDKNLGVLNDTVSRRIGYDTWLPSPNSGWDIYPMEIKAGDVLTLVTSVGNRQCYTVSSLTDSGSDYRLDEITLGQNVNNVLTATQDAIGIMFYGVGAVHVTRNGSIYAITETLSKRLFQNNNILTYNANKVEIDNTARTIKFNGNIAIIDTQGNTVTLGTNNKTVSFNAEVPTGGFSGTAMAVLVYKSDNTLAIKQYDKLASTDYALIGLRFDRSIGSGTTVQTNTQVVSYVSMLPIDIPDHIEKMIIIEKRDSLVGLGNNTFNGPKMIGELTPGQTYYVYVNNYKHTSAETGYLFAVRKDGSYVFSLSVGQSIPTETPVYSFVAEEGAKYGYGGRCDTDDSIKVEFLIREKETFDVDMAKEINRNNAFTSLLKETTTSVSKNSKLGSFLYVTDLHSNLASLKEMARVKSALNLSSAMLNGGDLVGGWPRTTANQAVIDEYMQICAANNIYHVMGQHEVGFAPMARPDDPIGRSKADVYSHQETFNRYFAPLKDGWGLPNLDKCYYYKDFGNVRLITLYHYNRPEIDDPNDSNYYKYQRALVWYGTEQLQWFANTLGSMSDGQVAVILCHQPTKTITPISSSKFQGGFTASAPNNITTDDPITEIITAFKNKTQLVKTYTPTDTTKYLVADGFEESVNADFSNAEGTIGFMVMGDNHYDAVGKSSNILCLCLTACGECTDGVITRNTGYNSDYIINAFGIASSKVELGRVGQQYFCGKLRDIENLSLT